MTILNYGHDFKVNYILFIYAIFRFIVTIDNIGHLAENAGMSYS